MSILTLFLLLFLFAAAALFHNIPLVNFSSIFIGFNPAKIEKFSYLCRLVY